MRYTIEKFNKRGRWEVYIANAGSLDDAIIMALSINQPPQEDRFPFGYRIVCDGSVVMTAALYDRQRRDGRR